MIKLFSKRVWIGLTAVCLGGIGSACIGAAPAKALQDGFLHPPEEAKPWVYWFVMDGNLRREGITADFEALKRAGIGGVLFMEVDVGIPKGPVKFMSPPWRDLFKHANAEAARLGLKMTMPASPGWTGSGGPWVKPEQSMQKLVSSETNFAGPGQFECVLPQPPTTAGFYRDVVVLAFPTPSSNYRIADIQEKALYHRGHYSSEAGVKALIPTAAEQPPLTQGQWIPSGEILDLTSRMDSTGRLRWNAPAGSWTVMRFGHTSTGANTRPAPEPGLGLECDKFDKAALESHFNEFLGKLMADIGPLTGKSLVALHIDSWEMGPQNWTARFPQEFQQRRGYSPLRYLPAMTGLVVDNLEMSERFLWDVRQTALELITENHARFLAELAHRRGMSLSIEPYDGTPCDDMTYGASADIPMGEFWRDTFNTWFSCTEASSIAHTYGRRIVQAEAFTSGDGERWLAHPASLKTLGDWAFCDGINRFVFHRYAHQPWLDRWPGMTMGPYGIHYDRTQTWFEQSRAWNEYLSRCQYLLQQGLFVADVCFLKPEASPQVFRPPSSAVRGTPPDRLGYNFDAITPEVLLTRMSVKNGRLTLPDGMSYRAMVLPETPAMTPALLRRIKELVYAGASIAGPRPLKSPSLEGFPKCDEEVKRLADEIWGGCDGVAVREHAFGKGHVTWERKPDSSLDTLPGNPIEKARWIWHREAEGNPASKAPVATRYFQRVVELGEGIESARVLMTADNTFQLWINGNPAGEGNNFHNAVSMDVLSLIKTGRNMLSVLAENGGEIPNPAGLLGILIVKYRDGRIVEVPTDARWQTAAAQPEHWLTGLESAGAGALELGSAGMAPWGSVSNPAAQPEVYGDYSIVTRMLGRMHVPPDFESSGPLRYIHRQAGNTDIYFVANKEDKWVGANCTFRVHGKEPELWLPQTGAIVKPALYRESDGRTVMPLWLEPSGSVFVVFKNKPGWMSAKDNPVATVFRDGKSLLPAEGEVITAPPSITLERSENKGFTLTAVLPGRYEIRRADGTSSFIDITDTLKPIEINGSWDLQFQPQRGAPDRITLDRLESWSVNSNQGVRHFSGNAVYRKQFILPANDLREKMVLDLGRVEVMARIMVNGRDLGILWKKPYQADITDAVKPGANALEIEVVNLWPNRLIGDQALPQQERISWTTWNPFSKDAPLLESGLLGPVTIQAEQRVLIKKSAFH